MVFWRYRHRPGCCEVKKAGPPAADNPAELRAELNHALVERCLGSAARTRGRTVRGFSLIEMLVALVVLSLSLGVLYQAATGATRNVRVAAEYIDAVMLAESMLADHSHVTEETYAASGSFGRYEWQVNSWPAAFEDGLNPEQRGVAPQALQYLEVVVSWPGRTAPRTLDLLTVVPLQAVTE